VEALVADADGHDAVALLARAAEERVPGEALLAPTWWLAMMTAS
jgi:hypothetical protein